MNLVFQTYVWSLIDELIKWVGAPAPFDFIFKIIIGFWFVFLVALLLYFPLFILIRMIRGRR